MRSVTLRSLSPNLARIAEKQLFSVARGPHSVIACGLGGGDGRRNGPEASVAADMRICLTDSAFGREDKSLSVSNRFVHEVIFFRGRDGLKSVWFIGETKLASDRLQITEPADHPE